MADATASIDPINEVFVKVSCPPEIAAELTEHFAFEAPGARFSPQFRKKRWDGIIKLFSATGRVYRGLAPAIRTWLVERKIACAPLAHEPGSYTDEDLERLYLPAHFEMRDYQRYAIEHCVQNKRAVIKLATGAGKSLTIYALAKYYRRALVIVDSLSLLQQMAADFRSYGCSDDDMHLVKGGIDPWSDKHIIIGTWQTIVKQPRDWFAQFDEDSVVIGDEAHGYDAKSLKAIMESLIYCPHRFGFTGTLKNESKVHRLVLEGLFGPIETVKTSAELIEEDWLSPVKVHCKVIKYGASDRAALNKMVAMRYEGIPKADRKTKGAAIKYQCELEFIYAHEGRNKFIRDLAVGLEGTVLILFQRLNHGRPLAEDLGLETTVPVFYVAGEVEDVQREKIRQIVRGNTESITVASVGVFSKGVDIPNINHIIVVSPTKAQSRTLQSIGRGLRKFPGKTVCNIYDISDDLSSGPKKNYTYKHFGERLRMYIKEDFPYRLEYHSMDGG